MKLWERGEAAGRGAPAQRRWLREAQEVVGKLAAVQPLSKERVEPGLAPSADGLPDRQAAEPAC